MLKTGRPYTLSIPGRDEELNATGDIDVTGPLTIRSAGVGRATIDAAGVDRAIDTFARLTVSKLKITGGRADADTYNLSGSGIRSSAGHSLTVLGSLIAGNRDLPGETGVGSGIARVGAGNLVVRHSTIRGNSAGLAAGGIYDGGLNSQVLIADSRILNNSTRPPDGFATGFEEFGDGTVVRIVRTLVAGNRAVEEGGGIWVVVNTLHLIDSTVAGNTALAGGGVFARKADVTISGSTIRNNRATGVFFGLSGGGVLHYANGENSAMSINRSTISGNRAPGGNGGGIDNWASGGSTATLRITNSTIAGNRAGGNGGGINNFVPDSGLASVSLNADTVADNVAGAAGGGVSNNTLAGVFSLENTLLARNSGSVSPQCTGILTSGGHNLTSGQPAGCTGLTMPGDALAANPRIGTLAANGGPTRTVALHAGSPAIGHAGRSTPRRDQRGVLRDSHPDIGAFERH